MNCYVPFLTLSSFDLLSNTGFYFISSSCIFKHVLDFRI